MQRFYSGYIFYCINNNKVKTSVFEKQKLYYQVSYKKLIITCTLVIIYMSTTREKWQIADLTFFFKMVQEVEHSG